MLSVEKWWVEHTNKRVEREAGVHWFCDDEECRVKRCIFSVFPLCRERPRIVMLWVEWFGRLKWRATGLEASLLSFLTSRRCSRKRSASFLPVSFVISSRLKFEAHQLAWYQIFPSHPLFFAFLNAIMMPEENPENFSVRSKWYTNVVLKLRVTKHSLSDAPWSVICCRLVFCSLRFQTKGLQ